MKTIYESVSTPKADGFRMPAEFEPQKRVWMGWPYRTDTWSFGAKPAQKQYADVARAISRFTPVYLCVNQADFAHVEAVFEEEKNITVIEMSSDDAWFRDTGATFVVNKKGEMRANHWHFNAYGGFIDGLYSPWDKDEQIALKMAEITRSKRYRPDNLILEGGSITVDGEGTVVVTDMCLLSPGRSASVTNYKPWSEELRAYLNKELSKYLNVEKIIWVKNGIDPEETNGHIDDVATFVAPGVMVCIWSDNPNCPFYKECHEAYETLSNATDAKGRKLKVYKLPLPAKPLYMTKEACDSIDVNENTQLRVSDKPLIASYVNYLVTNNGIIVPQYNDVNDNLAIETLQKIYDETWGKDVYKVVGVKSDQVVYGGGSIHCITQQEPNAQFMTKNR